MFFTANHPHIQHFQLFIMKYWDVHARASNLTHTGYSSIKSLVIFVIHDWTVNIWMCEWVISFQNGAREVKSCSKYLLKCNFLMISFSLNTCTCIGFLFLQGSPHNFMQLNAIALYGKVPNSHDFQSRSLAINYHHCMLHYSILCKAYIALHVIHKVSSIICSALPVISVSPSGWLERTIL